MKNVKIWCILSKIVTNFVDRGSAVTDRSLNKTFLITFFNRFTKGNEWNHVFHGTKPFSSTPVSPVKSRSCGNKALFTVPIKISMGSWCENNLHVFDKFQRTGSVFVSYWEMLIPGDVQLFVKNVTIVSAIIQQSPRYSITRVVAEFGLKRYSTYIILRNTLHMISCKILYHQELTIRTVYQKIKVLKRYAHMIDEDGFDVNCIWFSDEAFSHGTHLNRKNWRFLGT